MKTTIDQEAARELELYTENTRQIYDAYTVPTIRNLARKAKAGTYDKAKACKAWEHVAEAAAKLYCKEFAEPAAWHMVFNAATRRAVAASLEASYKAEYIDNGYEV